MILAVEKLKNAQIANEYKLSLSNRFEGLKEEEENESLKVTLTKEI